MAKSVINPNPNRMAPGLNHSPLGVTIAGLTKEYDTFPEMLADPSPGVFSLVKHAEGDPTVASGWAIYRTYTKEDGSYRKVMAEDVLNLSDQFKWDAITGRPGTIDPNNLYGPEKIDEAVLLKHLHNNKTILDTIKEIVDAYREGKKGIEFVNSDGEELQLITDAVFDDIISRITGRLNSAEGSINTINSKIPDTASSTNQLTTKEYVDNAIASSSARFCGSWNTWNDVPEEASAYPEGIAPSKNDYMVVINDTSHEHDGACWRYKYIGSWTVYGKTGWNPEYKIENKPFTEEQLAAINSGITAEKLGNIDTAIEVYGSTISTMSGNISNLQSTKQDNLTPGTNITISENNTISSTDDPADLVFNVTHTTYGRITNVKEALNALLFENPSLSDLKYKATINGTETSASNNQIFEVGTKISKQVFTWNRNKDVNTQTLSNINGTTITLGDPTSKTYTYTPTTEITKTNVGSVSNRLTIYLKKYDDTTVSTYADFNIYFKYRMYYGISKKEALSSSDYSTIKTWNKKFVGSNSDVLGTMVFDCTGDYYIFLVIPTNYSTGFEIWSGGLKSDGWITNDIILTNDNGVSVTYTTFRIPESQKGSEIKIELKAKGN